MTGVDQGTIRRHLERCSVFQRLESEEFDSLARQTVVRALEPGETLFHQDDPGNSAYVVAEGQLRLSRVTHEGRQVIVAFMTPGLLFAVVAALRPVHYPVTAVAITGTTVLGWTRETLAPYLRRHPEIAVEAMEIIAARMQELQERYNELATMPVPQRLAHTLLKLDEQRIESHAHALKLSRQDLAEMIGTTLFTVSRLLRSWDAEGIVSSGRESVTIRDRKRLSEMVEGVPEKS